MPTKSKKLKVGSRVRVIVDANTLVEEYGISPEHALVMTNKLGTVISFNASNDWPLVYLKCVKDKWFIPTRGLRVL